jgi:hypothetical protein
MLDQYNECHPKPPLSTAICKMLSPEKWIQATLASFTANSSARTRLTVEATP